VSIIRSSLLAIIQPNYAISIFTTYVTVLRVTDGPTYSDDTSCHRWPWTAGAPRAISGRNTFNESLQDNKYLNYANFVKGRFCVSLHARTQNRTQNAWLGPPFPRRQGCERQRAAAIMGEATHSWRSRLLRGPQYKNNNMGGSKRPARFLAWQCRTNKIFTSFAKMEFHNNNTANKIVHSAHFWRLKLTNDGIVRIDFEVR